MVLAVVTAFLPPASGAAAPLCLSGAGTSVDPFLVTSPDDLARVGNGTDGCTLGAHYLQTARIVLAAPSEDESNYVPIGSSEGRFTGVYDGGAFEIVGLTITGGIAGLFGATGPDAVIRGIRITAGAITGQGGTVGGLIADADRTQVSDSSFAGSVAGSVAGTGNTVGGLIGYASHAVLTDVSFVGTVSGALYVGGIVGQSEYLSLTRSSFSGTVSGSADVGGLAGSATLATITDSSATGTVSATGSDVGGIVGEAFGPVITGVSFDGSVRGIDAVGGIAGAADANDPGFVITRVSATGTVDGRDLVGGLVGYAELITVSRSFSSAVVVGTGSDVGGLIGGATDLTVDEAFATGAVTGGAYVGGLVGYVNRPVISASYATGAVTGPNGADVGGLIAAAFGVASVTDSFWDVGTSGQQLSAGGAGRTTQELTTITTFLSPVADELDVPWAIVAGWTPFLTNGAVWGICSAANAGYPFLLWRFTTDPCDVSGSTVDPTSIAAASPVVACDGPPVAGRRLSCTVTGGGPGIDILWRAAYNPVIAEGGVSLDAAGTGTFSFLVPTAALGRQLTVELVEWARPVPIGIAGGPVPSTVPSGGGPVPAGPLLALTLLAAVSWLGLRRDLRRSTAS